MEMTPVLDLALGLFFTVFGPIVISVAISQMRQTRERYQLQSDSWKLPAFLLTTLIASLAAFASGWVYLLGREPRFLAQTLIALFMALVGALSIWRESRARHQRLRISFVYLNDYGLAVSSGAMAVCGVLMLVTLPFNTLSGAVVELRTFTTIIGVIAGFSTVGIMLFSVLLTDPT